MLASIGFGVGLLLTLALVWWTRGLLDFFLPEDVVGDDSPSEIAAFFESVSKAEGAVLGGVRLLGILESVFFYWSFWIGEPQWVGGWLALKVATKWQVWQQVIRLPEKSANVEDLQITKFRAVWGTILYNRFLLGTIYNIVVAIVAASIGHLLPSLIGAPGGNLGTPKSEIFGMQIRAVADMVSVLSGAAGAFALAFALRVRPGISSEMRRKLSLEERPDLVVPSDVRPRRRLFVSGLLLVAVAAALQIAVIVL